MVPFVLARVHSGIDFLQFGLWGHFLSFWPFGASFPFILIFWGFISFHFGLLGLHFLHFGLFGLHFPSFWPYGPSFPFILAFWAVLFFDFGLLALHLLHFGLLALHFPLFWPFGSPFLSFWPFGPSFFHFWLVWAATWGPPRKLPKMARFLMKFKQILSAPRPAAFCNFWPFGPSFPFILVFWAFISFHFGLLGLHFLSFWPFGRLFPFVLAFWAFISFHFGLLGLHFLHFWLVGGATCPPHKLPKTARFLTKFKQILSAPRPTAFCNFWPFGPSFPFILAFWAFISFHFGLLGLPFFSFWPFGPSFPFIFCDAAPFPFVVAFSAFISVPVFFLGAGPGSAPRRCQVLLYSQPLHRKVIPAKRAFWVSSAIPFVHFHWFFGSHFDSRSSFASSSTDATAAPSKKKARIFGGAPRHDHLDNHLASEHHNIRTWDFKQPSCNSRLGHLDHHLASKHQNMTTCQRT